MPKYLSKGFRNVMIVGMPATGKTDLGIAYAHTSGRSFLDFDRYVERMVGKTIPEIFASEGEAGFREMESKALQKLSKRHHSVISCGGGTFANEANAHIISEMGLVVCLESPNDVLAARILLNKESRPLFKNCIDAGEVEQKLASLLAVRQPYFDRAHVHLQTAFSSVDNLKLELCHKEKKAWGEERKKKPKETPKPFITGARPGPALQVRAELAPDFASHAEPTIRPEGPSESPPERAVVRPSIVAAGGIGIIAKRNTIKPAEAKPKRDTDVINESDDITAKVVVNDNQVTQESEPQKIRQSSIIPKKPETLETHIKPSHPKSPEILPEAVAESRIRPALKK